MAVNEHCFSIEAYAHVSEPHHAEGGDASHWRYVGIDIARQLFQSVFSEYDRCFCAKPLVCDVSACNTFPSAVADALYYHFFVDSIDMLPLLKSEDVCREEVLVEKHSVGYVLIACYGI